MPASNHLCFRFFCLVCVSGYCCCFLSVYPCTLEVHVPASLTDHTSCSRTISQDSLQCRAPCLYTALQAATNEQYTSGSSTLSADAVSKTLHIQAAKVVAAHAASVGDNLLGVPLLCSAGTMPTLYIDTCAISRAAVTFVDGHQLVGQ